MGKGKLWPSANQKPLHRSFTKFEWRNYVTDAYHQKNLGLIRPGVFAPHIGEIYTPPVRNILHFGTWTRLQASPLDRFLRLIRQMTRFCARKCFVIVIKSLFLPPPRRLCFCRFLFVCLCVSKITQKVMDGSFWIFEGMSGMAKATSGSILWVIRKESWILDHSEIFVTIAFNGA